MPTFHVQVQATFSVEAKNMQLATSAALACIDEARVAHGYTVISSNLSGITVDATAIYSLEPPPVPVVHEDPDLEPSVPETPSDDDLPF